MITRIAARNSNFSTVITFIGATRGSSSDYSARSVIDSAEVIKTPARRKATALTISSNMSQNSFTHTSWSNGPVKYFRGNLIAASFGSSALYAKNLWALFCAISSSQWCPVTRQLSSKWSRAPTVNGATRQMDNRRSTKRCGKVLVTTELLHLLTTNVSLVTYHSSPLSMKR